LPVRLDPAPGGPLAGQVGDVVSPLCERKGEIGVAGSTGEGDSSAVLLDQLREGARYRVLWRAARL
jgi:hypothetical protein